METLEVKHLAPYLPYGIRVFDVESETTHELIGLDREKLILRINRFPYIASNFLNKIKPILCPLSEFQESQIQEIKDFVGLGRWCDYYDNFFDRWFYDVKRIQILANQMPYEIAQFFFANHFDVLGLIEKGLAIDINTLKIMEILIFKIRSAIYDFEVRNSDVIGKQLAVTLNTNVVRKIIEYNYRQNGKRIPSEVNKIIFDGHLVFPSDFIPEGSISIGYLTDLK